MYNYIIQLLQRTTPLHSSPAGCGQGKASSRSSRRASRGASACSSACRSSRAAATCGGIEDAGHL